MVYICQPTTSGRKRGDRGARNTYKCSLQDCSERQRLLVEIGIIKRSETLLQVTHLKPAFLLQARG